MVKDEILTKLTVVEIGFFLLLFFGRFLLATYISVNYSKLSFYQEYKDRLLRANNHLELRVSQENNLASLADWAKGKGFSFLTKYQKYPEKQIIAQR